jgi:hypothetical protein
VSDLTAYRSTKAKTERNVKTAIPDAEETITEIAKYVLLIVEAITRQRH